MSLNAELTAPTYASKRVGALSDLHPIVTARVVCEWARIDREFPMQLWGHEYLGTHIRVGSFKYYIAYNAQQPEIFIQITEEDEPNARQRTWRLRLDDLKTDGVNAALREV